LRARILGHSVFYKSEKIFVIIPEERKPIPDATKLFYYGALCRLYGDNGTLLIEIKISTSL
jgi:hypothetical protein